MTSFRFDPPFVSAHWRAMTVIGLLCLGMLFDVIAIFSTLSQINLLQSLQAGIAVPDATLTANDLRQGFIGLAQVLTYVLTAIFFLAWIHRAHRNLTGLGVQNLEYSPGWAVGWWFVPIANLFKPFQVTREIWNASDPDSRTPSDWSVEGTPPLLGAWWGVYIVSGIVGRMAFSSGMRAEQPAELLSFSQMSLFSDGLGLVSAILCLLVVKGIDDRQTQKYTRLSARGYAPAPGQGGTPAYGTASPAYGATSPAYGAGSPAYSSQGIGYGAATADYGSSPTAYGAAQGAQGGISHGAPTVSTAYAHSPQIDPAAAQYQIGSNHYQAGRMLEAADAYRQAIRMNPSWPEAHYALGLAYLAMRDHASAMSEHQVLENLNQYWAGMLMSAIQNASRPS